jgi:predicted choloylglycine hydrolase
MLVKFDNRVGQYVKLRDLIKAKEDKHKEELKPFKEALEKLNVAMVAHLTSVGADSVNTQFGTVYRTIKKSATIADMDLFWSYVTTNSDFDMIDKKANKTRVEDYINENGGQLPPGVTFSQVEQVGVRRKSGT